MKQLCLIIEREYITKIRNKSFVIMTFVSPLAIIFLSFFIGYLTNINNNSQKNITIFDESTLFSQTFKNTKNINYQYITNGNIEEIKKEALQEQVYGILYISKDVKSIHFFSEETPSLTFIENLTHQLENAIFYQNLQNQNISLEDIKAAKVKINIDLQDFVGEKSSKLANGLKLIFGGAAGYLLMMFIIIYGNMIMRSVIEEKTSRIIEIIVSSVKPIQLMLGKIIGTSLVGITQFILWLIIGGILMVFLTNIFGVTPSNPIQTTDIQQNGQIVQEVLLEFFKFPIMKLVFCFLIYFIGGYLLYSSMYATIGSAVDNETDTQQFILPVLMPLMLAIYVGFFTVIEDPHGSVSQVFSFIPFTSPVVMLMRIPFGVSWWEVSISVILLYLTFFMILWFAAKIYRVGILMYGKKPSYKELIKWLKIK
ncbi:MAG: ABC transporter permease [Capnocytophaga sp.]|nr:ABC transporter permease [Capnocytophaga sp.]